MLVPIDWDIGFLGSKGCELPFPKAGLVFFFILKM